VLVQGTARIVDEPDPKYLARVVGPAVVQYLGAPKTGVFWDRWLAAYKADRVPVHVDVERIVSWPALSGAGAQAVEGAPWPEAGPDPQSPPRRAPRRASTSSAPPSAPAHCRTSCSPGAAPTASRCASR